MTGQSTSLTPQEMAVETTQQQDEGDTVMEKSDDNVESSSTGSDGGKGGGSGSGGGYSADNSTDCSSSDASSLEAAKGNAPDKEMTRLNLNGDSTKDKPTKTKETKPNKNLKSSTPKSQKTCRRSSEQAETSHSGSVNHEESSLDSGTKWKNLKDTVEETSSFPQWNGVRIHHPMDPRIDLSTVGHIQTSSLSAFPSNVDIPTNQNAEPQTSHQADTPGECSEPPPPPSIDQYMKLMEVVRPFFHAHGITQGFSQTRSDEQSNGRSSSDFAAEPSDSDQKHSTDESKFEVPVAAWKIPQPTVGSSAYASHPNRDPDESDSSSMIVLARAKRKHLKKPAEDAENDGSNNSTNDGSNTSSSSEKRVRIQQPQNAEAEGFQNEEAGTNEDESNTNDGKVEQARPQADAADRQESASASSSEDRNNQNAPQNAPLRYPAPPAVVSEYSSSARAGSSGASNNNLMSTSGSGSGGNTGSGTGSGSNQGGSSGSGNDQGAISSNGNGSSGSGNDVKGSSEETMDNSGENNSGGNSDATNSNIEKQKNAACVTADAPHANSGHRHAPNAPETAFSPPSVPSLPHQPHAGEDENATREKKLQDKKRKRMNMRREYEEKVQQEMESSEGSRDRGEVLIKPGRPVTLDKVLSFTKVARIVIKAGPPFLVVYTNAAYCRLSGIDSHAAVGKPISSLLSIPDQDMLAEVGANQESLPLEHSTAAVAQATEDGFQERILPQPKNRNAEDTTASQSRARAAASQETNSDMCLERLVAASGFGRCHVINVLAKPHHMLGRNVTVTKPSAAPQMRNREGVSNGSSITSGYDGPYHAVPCSMSVSPVVSSPEAFNVAVVTDKDQDNHHHKTKRRKHHHHSDSQQLASNAHRRLFLMREVSMHRKRHLITHYVIQLDTFEGNFRKLESHSSTSTTVEAHILGLTKSELRRVRTNTQVAAPPAPAEGTDRPLGEEEDDEMESEFSEPREPVTAIG